MVTVGVSSPYSLVKLSASLFSPRQLLLADHCCHDFLETRQAVDFNAFREPVSIEKANGGQQIDGSELINAAVPRVSCCLLDASLALDDKRIEDLCAHLAQASTILHEVLVAVSPNQDACEREGESSAIDTKADVELTPIPDGGEGARVIEIARAMAAAA